MEEENSGHPTEEARAASPGGGGGGAKRGRHEGCFSFMEISIEPGIRSLKHLDSKKLKAEIKRWAKAVVGYARQISGRFGSSGTTV